MELSKLKEKMNYRWKVQTTGGQCVAYVDARDVMDKLDEVVGAENWQRKYYQVKNTMFCSIGIKVGEEWVWKDDNGVESDYEKEKGESSDSFKRAAVNWGIGRFLYDLEIRWVDIREKKPVDKNGNIIKDLTAYFEKLDKNTPEVQPYQNKNSVSPRPIQAPQDGQINICSQCKVKVDDDVKGYSLKKYGKVLCRDCQKLN